MTNACAVFLNILLQLIIFASLFSSKYMCSFLMAETCLSALKLPLFETRPDKGGIQKY